MTAADSSQLSILSGWYLFGSILVWVGVFLEGAEIAVRRFSKRKHKETPPWAHTAGDFGWLILIIGLGLEVPIGHRIDGIKSNQIATLTANLDSTVKIAAVLNDRASSNELQVAVMTGENLKLKTDLAMLQSIVQWRRISPQQETNLISLLKPVANGAPVNILAEGENPEVRLFASNIAEVLSRCGFKVFFSPDSLNIGVKRGVGIEIDVKDARQVPAHAEHIFKAFETNKVSPVLTRAEDARVVEGRVLIWVLPKPEKIWAGQ